MSNEIKQGFPTTFENQTGFQVYKAFDPLLAGQKNVIDFTEHKLLAFAKKQPATLAAKTLTLQQQYKTGCISICWKRGAPYYVFTHTSME